MANLSDFTKKIQVTELTVDYKGEEINFHIRPIMAGHQEVVLQKMGDMFKIYAKKESAKDLATDQSQENHDNEDSAESIKKRAEAFMMSMTGEEFKLMSTKDRTSVLYRLCDEKGKLLYHSYDSMVSKIPDDLLTIIVAKVAEVIEEEVEDKEEVEKK